MSRLAGKGCDPFEPLSAAQLVVQAPSTALCSSGCGLEALRASALWLIRCLTFATPAVLPVLYRNKRRVRCTALRKAVGSGGGHVRAHKLCSRPRHLFKGPATSQSGVGEHTSASSQQSTGSQQGASAGASGCLEPLIVKLGEHKKSLYSLLPDTETG